MKNLTQGGIIRLLREEYETQLLQKLEEVALFDSRGTMVIGKDLKVIHKPSGFVYTVKGVTGEPGSAKVVLRAPEEPRVQPATAKETTPTPAERMGAVAEDSNPEGDSEKQDKRDYGHKAYPKPKTPPEHDTGETMFVVDQKEFEKYYKEA